MASIVELAELALRVYRTRAHYPVSPWTSIRRFTYLGFHAELFFKQESDEYCLSIRGTDELWKLSRDPLDDALIVVRSQRKKHKRGLAFGPREKMREFAAAILLRCMAETAGKNFILTGHSLGGGFAAYLAAIRRLPAVTFNSLTFGLPVADSFWDRADSSSLIHVRSSWDIAHVATREKRGRHIVLAVDTPSLKSDFLGLMTLHPAVAAGYLALTAMSFYYQQHKMSNLLSALRRHPCFQLNLELSTEPLGGLYHA